MTAEEDFSKSVEWAKAKDAKVHLGQGQPADGGEAENPTAAFRFLKGQTLIPFICTLHYNFFSIDDHRQKAASSLSSEAVFNVYVY